LSTLLGIETTTARSAVALESGQRVLVLCGTVFRVSRKVWTAPEFERLSPAEQDAVFDSSVISDLDQVPAEFLDRVRRRFQERTSPSESPQQPT
jgi:hypothetical protein